MTNHQLTHIENCFECPRCDARGFIDEFSHIASGRCFLCGGAKKISLKTVYPKKVGYAEYRKGTHKYRVRKNSGVTVWQTEKIEDILVIWGSTNSENFTSVFQINDLNREEMRHLWRWLQINKFKLEIKKDLHTINEGCTFTEDGRII